MNFNVCLWYCLYNYGQWPHYNIWSYMILYKWNRGEFLFPKRIFLFFSCFFHHWRSIRWQRSWMPLFIVGVQVSDLSNLWWTTDGDKFAIRWVLDSDWHMAKHFSNPNQDLHLIFIWQAPLHMWGHGVLCALSCASVLLSIKSRQWIAAIKFR